jgi:hypothetical protein
MIDILLLFAVLPAFLAIVTALLLDWRWPAAPARRQAVIASLVPGVAVLGLGLWLWLRSRGESEGSTDAEGYALMAVMWVLSYGLLISLVIGFLAGHFTIRYLRGR